MGRVEGRCVVTELLKGNSTSAHTASSPRQHGVARLPSANLKTVWIWGDRFKILSLSYSFPTPMLSTGVL